MTNPQIQFEDHIKPIGNKNRLVDQVVQAIQDQITSHNLTPGTKLPNERDLAVHLGVSRTVVREAVHILAARGLLISKRKLGTIVRTMQVNMISEPMNLLLKTRGVTLDNLHQVRSMLEVEAAGLAVDNATEEEIRALEMIVVLMEDAQTGLERYAQLDADFHHHLSAMSHNALLVMLSDSMAEVIAEVRREIVAAPQLFLSARSDHRRIYEQIFQRKRDGAKNVMCQHLINARKIQDDFIRLQEKLGFGQPLSG